MAQVIDAGGKRKASSSGKAFTGGKDASKLIEDLSRNSNIFPQQSGTPNGIERLKKDLGTNEIVSPGKTSTASTSDTADVIASRKPKANAFSPAQTVPSSSPLDSPVSMTQRQKARVEPLVQTASMAAPQFASDNRYKEPDSWTSDDTNLHGEKIRENTWFPWSDAGPTRTNDIYERDMIDNGMSMDYLDSVLREDDVIGSATDNVNELDPKWRKDLMNQLTTAVDDGTMDRPHLLSDWMTGKQYYHYVHDLGMPGMPESEISVNDDARYSKAEQSLLHGFTPYVPNEEYSAAWHSVPTGTALTRMLSDYVSNLRTRGFLDDVDYDIATDTGYGYKAFSGRDFDRKSPGYFSQSDMLYEAANNGDKNALSKLIDTPDNDSYTTMVKQTQLPDGSFHYGILTGISADNPDNYIDHDNYSYDDKGNLITTTKDGYILNLDDSGMIINNDAFNNWINLHSGYHLTFSDGSSSDIPASMEDELFKNYENSGDIGDVSWVPYEKAGLNVDPRSLNVGDISSLNDRYEESGAGVGAYFSPDLVLSDGTRISRDVAEKIAEDENPNDADKDGISYSFQRSGLNPLRSKSLLNEGIMSMAYPILAMTDSRPRRFLKMPIDDEGLHVLDLPNNMADWAANSATISVPYLQWVNAFSQAMPYAAGVEGSRRNDDSGRYDYTGYDPDDNDEESKNAMMSVPVLAGPALENLAGNIGHETWLDDVVNPMIDRKLVRGTLPNILAHKAFDMFGEGIEENFGDVVDEFGTYGKNAYANPSQSLPDDIDVYDEDGNLIKPAGMPSIVGQLPTVMYDRYGRELRDPDTSMRDRFMNFVPHRPEQVQEGLNSFVGGASISGLLGFPSTIRQGIGSMAQRNRGDWGRGSYAAHMDALGREMPYAGKSLDYARRDMRRKLAGRTIPDIDVPQSLISKPYVNTDGSDIIQYGSEDYLVPDDFQLPEK